MQKPPKIRAKVLGWIRQGDRVFVTESYDPGKQQLYYRSLGGSIEFGETSLDALKREFMEEIQAELINIQYLCCIENLFTFEGNPGHEIIQLYQCDFADPTFYQREKVTVYEEKIEGVAYWVPIGKFKSGELRLVPEACLDYL
ncbi:NUDIX domain-containing protein [Kovacikia minuta CCNUW1]|uniref:NUDIX hydrolase n=1 Tax=Kovacikia minuta TaxID=2931930 RepID=UPI001CCBE178|nr:NUDIX domain-containing protein [Kovacikia minuta]UBF27707.1 NUDIX domain-containing protein [Kovacikia minuta CCNUW1]